MLKRHLIAALCVSFMKITGFRFSKEYRWGTTKWKRFVYRNVSTVQANIWAGMKL